MKRKTRGLLIGTFVGLSSVPLIVSVGLVCQRDSRLNVKLYVGNQNQQANLFGHESFLPSTSTFAQPLGSDLIPQRDLAIDAQGTLTQLTNKGKLQPVIIIPAQVKKIAANAFNDCAFNLTRIIFEDRQELALELDQGALQELPVSVTFYVAEGKKSSPLVEALTAAGIQPERILTFKTDENYSFYIGASPAMPTATGLLALTPNGQTHPSEILMIPQEINYVYEYAFDNFPESVTEIDWRTKKQIELVGSKVFRGLENLKRFRVYQTANALKLISNGIDPTKTDLIIDTPDGQFEVKIIDQCIVGVSQDQRMVLIGLTSEAATKKHLTIPASISVIEENALAGSNASVIEFLHDGHLTVNGSIPDIEYTAWNLKAVHDLIAAGAGKVNFHGKEEAFTLYVDQDYLLRDHANGNVELYGLSPSGKKKDRLVIVPKIKSINPRVWRDVNAKRIEFQGDHELKIDGELPTNWNCLVQNRKTAFNLLNSGVKQVEFERKGEVATLVNEEGYVYQINSSPLVKWVGVLKSNQNLEKLVISPKANIVGPNAFDGIQPKFVKFEHDGEISIEGPIPNIEYEVRHENTAETLRDFGVTNPINVVSGEEHFVEHVENGCAIRQQGSMFILVSLTEDGKRQEILEVPKSVNVVRDHAFSGSYAKKIRFLQDYMIRFEGEVPNVEYEVKQLSVADDLIGLGVTERIWIDDEEKGMYTVQAKGSCVIKTDQTGASLLSLTSSGRHEKEVRIPSEVAYVTKDSLFYSQATKIIFENPHEIKFDGPVPDVVYEVNNVQTASNLHKFNLTNPIVINEDKKTYRDYLNGEYWLRTNADGVTKFVGLTQQGQTQKLLTIPPEVSVVDKDALKQISAEKIVFNTNRPVTFESDVANVDYEVNHVQTALNLFNAGARRSVSVNEDDKHFVLHTENETIFKTDGSEFTTLVGLSEAGKKLEELVIPAQINVVGENALAESVATKVMFEHDGVVNIIGTLPNKRYFVKHEDTSEKIIDAKVSIPVTVNMDGKLFAEKNDDGLLIRIRLIDLRLVLRKVIQEAMTKPELVVHDKISVIAPNAFDQASASRIILEGDEIKIDGPVPDVNYHVKNITIAQQLVAHGVTKTIFVNGGGTQFELYVKEGCVIKFENGIFSLIDLKKERKESTDELIIPSEVSLIADGALSGIKARKVRALHEGLITVGSDLADTNYVVHKLETAVDIAKTGISKNVSVEQNGSTSSVWIEDGCILEQRDEVISLVGLVDEAKSLPELIVPAKVNNVSSKALAGINAQRIIFLNNEQITVQGPLPDVVYEVKNVASAVNLIRAQVKQKVVVNANNEIFNLKAHGEFILRGDPGRELTSLFGLVDPSLKEVPVLKIPESVEIFDWSALGDLVPKRIHFLCDDEVKIVGPVADIEYDVKSVRTAINLINAGVTKEIHVNKFGRSFKVYGDGVAIIKLTQGDKRFLVGLTNKGKNENLLVIPENILTVESGSLNQSQASKICFEADNEVKIEGNVKNVAYEVGHIQTALNLFSAGVTQDIVVNEKQNSFVLHVQNEAIFKTDQSEFITLIGLTETGKKFSSLSIPAQINMIGENAFRGASALEVIFENEDGIEIASTLPDKHYVVKNEADIKKIRDAGVTTPVGSFQNGKAFFEQLRDGLFIRSIDKQKILWKLDQDAQQRAVLTIPDDVQVIADGSLDEATAYQINLENSELKLAGTIPNVNYKVKNLKVAEQLIDAGVTRTIAVNNGGHYYEIRLNNDCVIKSQNGTNTLIKLKKERLENSDELVIPANVNVIGDGSLTGLKARTIRALNRDEIKVENIAPDREYFVSNLKTAINLAQAGVSKNINVDYSDTASNVWVEDGCILEQNEKTVTLIGFLNEKKKAETLVIPPVVNAIGEKVFDDVLATRINLMSDGIVEISGSVPDVTYEVQNIDNAVNLIRAQVKQKIEVHTNDRTVTLQVQDNFITQTDADQKTVLLFGLTDSSQTEIPVLEVPANINTFSQDALKGRTVKRVRFLSDDEVKIIGQVDDLEFEVKNLATAVNLANATVKRSVVVNENDETYLIQTDGSVIVKVNKTGEKLLIGLTNEGRSRPTLTIPKDVLKIKEGSLTGLQATRILLESEPGVEFEGDIPDVEYEVRKIETALKLVNRGLKQKISLVENNAIYTIWWDRGYLVKSDVNGLSELIGLTSAVMEQDQLDIPDHVIVVGENILTSSKAKKIRFNHHGLIHFTGNVPNVEYEVNNTKTANSLLAQKGVDVPIKVHENGRTFIQKIVDNLIVQQEHEDMFLVGLTPLLQDQPELTVIEEISVLNDDALANCSAKQIDLLYDGEIKINGTVPDVDYRVKSLKTATNLVNAGVKTGQIYVNNNGTTSIVKVENGCVLKTDQFGTTSLIGIDREYVSNIIDVPEAVSVIDFDVLKNLTFNLVRINSNDDIQISGEIPNVDFEVTNDKIADKFVKRGVQSRIKVGDGPDSFIIQSNINNVLKFKDESVTLSGLVDYQAKELVVSHIVTDIDPNALGECNELTKIIFARDSQLNDHGMAALVKFAKTATFYAYDQNIVEKLKIAKIGSEQIGVARGDFFVCDGDPNKIVGLTLIGQQNKEAIMIPKNITSIANGAFDGCQATIIDFTQISDSSKLLIYGQPFTNLKTRYRVNDMVMARKLTQAGGNTNQIQMVNSRKNKHPESNRMIGLILVSIFVGILTVGLGIGISRKHKQKR